jgi:hypothetical protein
MFVCLCACLCVCVCCDAPACSQGKEDKIYCNCSRAQTAKSYHHALGQHTTGSRRDSQRVEGSEQRAESKAADSKERVRSVPPLLTSVFKMKAVPKSSSAFTPNTCTSCVSWTIFYALDCIMAAHTRAESKGQRTRSRNKRAERRAQRADIIEQKSEVPKIRNRADQ